MEYLVDIIIPPVPKAWTYAIPAELAAQVAVGYRVEVPFGNRFASGFVLSEPKVGQAANLPFKVKSIQKFKSSYPFFIPAQIRFFQWIADYYGCDLSTVIDCALPPSVTQKFERIIRFAKDPEPVLRGKLERALMETIKASAEPLLYSVLTRRFRGAGPVLKRLAEHGLISFTEHEVLQSSLVGKAPHWARTEVTLNAAQAQATETICKQIEQRKFGAFLLHGVTGSGKTEVYIEALRYALARGFGALIIVPEIALTPQLIDRFQARLGNDIAVLHSALQRRMRWDAWRRLLEKQCFVAIGARSGIFAPISPLGLIIVDEEHDGSYKQGEGLRYNARDLAVVRGTLEHCPVVLGSATPALESVRNAQSGKYALLSLPSRPQEMGRVELKLVDLNQVKPWQMPSRNVSPILRDALHDTLERKEQAFILYNRRGFAAYLQCEKCSTVVKCPNCSVVLTYHRQHNSLLCHYCNLALVPPTFCPECMRLKTAPPGKLTQRGSGTERVFDEIKNFFPDARLDRLDRDSAKDIQSYRQILERVRNRETDILVGTQMIAKGHDLPAVTLVGIIDCDVGLHLPDFRAAERVFQLLTQAAGRTGRGKNSGCVILQTRVPQHPSLIYTLTNDFNSFANQELVSRKALLYPPFSRILRIVAQSTDSQLILKVLEQCKSKIKQTAAENSLAIQILGPAPAPIEKIKTQWRAHMLIKCRQPGPLIRIVNLLQNERAKSTKYRLIFDMDPQDLM